MVKNKKGRKYRRNEHIKCSANNGKANNTLNKNIANYLLMAEELFRYCLFEKKTPPMRKVGAVFVVRRPQSTRVVYSAITPRVGVSVYTDRQ